MANIKVAVRVRPISTRELKITGSETVVHVESKKISLINPKVPSSRTADSRKRIKQFNFDYCFDSSDLTAYDYAGQEKIYKILGVPVLDSFFTGYNASVVAYGQSASGKSYTMMGTDDDPGLIPRICKELFERAYNEEKNGKILRFFVSYLEIYNEKVRDLLNHSTNASCLKIREHPRSGPYVEGLTQFEVKSSNSLMSCLKEGTQARKTASTLQNLTSSRSHALLTLSLEFSNSISGDSTSKVLEKSQKKNNCSRCKLHLVDLAGSEKSTACAGISSLKEGANINKSLVALGNVISALAERGSTSHALGKRFIPYRDSTLTWLLKDSFGGNATTIMLATISPAGGSYNETAHTLRFAQRAQSVINKPVISEDPVLKIIRQLQAEILQLKAQLLEKDTELNSKCRSLCTCQNNREQALIQQDVNVKTLLPPTYFDESNFINSSSSILRRHSFDDYLTSKFTILNPLKKVGSLESISDFKNFKNSKTLFNNKNYDASKFAKTIDYSFDESAFVDIPTLVAVLINADANAPTDSHQIEEISSSSTHIDPIDERTNTFINNIPSTKTQLPIEYQIENLDNLNIPSTDEKSKIKYSVTKTLTQPNLILNSFESIEKKVAECTTQATKKYSCLKENGKERLKNLVTKRYNDREIKTVIVNHDSAIKKQSCENIDQVISKNNGFNNLVDDDSTILITENIKNTRRNSTDPDQLLPRQHTTIQRVRRAEIVAAVTERLYSSKRASEDSNTASTPASDIRSPENSEAKFPPVTRMRLREISRKMLAKRRRVCADTQTDNYPTVRVRDAGILAKEPKIICKDASILTDRHEDFDSLLPCSSPVIRLKEIATSTIDYPLLKPTILVKDASSITENYDDKLISCYVEGNSKSENSTNTCPANEPKHSCNQTLNSDILTEISDTVNPNELINCQHNDVRYLSNQSFKCCLPASVTTDCSYNSKIVAENHCCSKIVNKLCQCENSEEKSIISLSIPDTINITIESPNNIDSKLQIVDNNECKVKDENVQTEKKVFLNVETSTENVKKINIRESWTNTRAIDQQTNTEPLKFEKLLDNLYETTKSLGDNSMSNDIFGSSNLVDEISENKKEIRKTYQTNKPFSNSIDKDMSLTKEEWFAKNRHANISYQGNNGSKYLINSTKNEYNFFNLDDNLQSKLNIKTRNLLRHYSWRNIRRTKINNLDKKLRQWNRLNFSNQIKNIKRKTSELSWTDNDLSSLKTVHDSDCYKQNLNYSNHNFHWQKNKIQCISNAQKTLDVINDMELMIPKKKDMKNSYFTRKCSLDDFNIEYLELPKKSEESNCLKSPISIPLIFPLGGNLTDIKKANEMSKNRRKVIEKINAEDIIIPILNIELSKRKLLSQSCVDFSQFLHQSSDNDDNVNFDIVNPLNLAYASTGINQNNESDLKKNELTKNKNLIKDYLKETIIFMRNINFMNELVGAESIKKKQLVKSKNSKKIEQGIVMNYKVDKKTSGYESDNFHRYYDTLQKNEFEQNIDAKVNSVDNQVINDKDFSLKLDDVAMRKILNTRIFNNYLKQCNSSDKKHHSEYIVGNKNADNKFTNNYLDDFNSHVYLKITNNENDFISKGRKLLSSPRCTIPKYDSSIDYSSSNETFENFIMSIQNNYKYRNKRKVSASPRMKLLKLLSERRQIIENSSEIVFP